MPTKSIPVGTRFARLKVVGVGKPHIRNNGWIASKSIVVCDCGKIQEASNSELRGGHKKLCGCLRKEGSRLTHGHARKGKVRVTFSIWQKMIDRCHSPRNKGFEYYGGRGIFVCQEWRDSYLEFFKYVGDRPSGLSLERINNSDGYRPGNVKWATRKEQSNNRRPRRWQKRPPGLTVYQKPSNRVGRPRTVAS